MRRCRCDPFSTRNSHEDDAELSEAPTADGQMSHYEGKQGSEHGEQAAEANAQSDTKKNKGRASKSAIGKTAKQPTDSHPCGRQAHHRRADL